MPAGGSGRIECVPAQVVEAHVFERARMRGGEQHRRRDAGFERLPPAGGAQHQRSPGLRPGNPGNSGVDRSLPHAREAQGTRRSRARRQCGCRCHQNGASQQPLRVKPVIGSTRTDGQRFAEHVVTVAGSWRKPPAGTGPDGRTRRRTAFQCGNANHSAAGSTTRLPRLPISTIEATRALRLLAVPFRPPARSAPPAAAPRRSATAGTAPRRAPATAAPATGSRPRPAARRRPRRAELPVAQVHVEHARAEREQQQRNRHLAHQLDGVGERRRGSVAWMQAGRRSSPGSSASSAAATVACGDRGCTRPTVKCSTISMMNSTTAACSAVSPNANSASGMPMLPLLLNIIGAGRCARRCRPGARTATGSPEPSTTAMPPMARSRYRSKSRRLVGQRPEHQRRREHLDIEPVDDAHVRPVPAPPQRADRRDREHRKTMPPMRSSSSIKTRLRGPGAGLPGIRPSPPS